MNGIILTLGFEGKISWEDGAEEADQETGVFVPLPRAESQAFTPVLTHRPWGLCTAGEKHELTLMLRPQLPAEGNARAGDQVQRQAHRRKDFHFPLIDEEEVSLTMSGFCVL